MRVIRYATYSSLTAGVWEPVGSPITADESGQGKAVTVSITPDLAPVIDASLLRVGIRRGLAVVHEVPTPYSVYRDLTSTTDYSAPTSVQSLPVNWRIEPGDRIVIYGGSGNGCTVCVVVDVDPVQTGVANRLTPLPGDGVLPPATWAMASSTSRARWALLRYLVLGAMLGIVAMGCTTHVVTVTCRVSNARGSTVNMECRPASSASTRTDGEFDVNVPSELLLPRQKSSAYPNESNDQCIYLPTPPKMPGGSSASTWLN